MLATHRQSLAESLHSVPSSPRSVRHPSFTQAALQDLISSQSQATHRNRKLNPRFADRDWHDVAIGELAMSEDVKWVTMDTTVEEATKVSSYTLLANPVVASTDASTCRSC